MELWNNLNIIIFALQRSIQDIYSFPSQELFNSFYIEKDTNKIDQAYYSLPNRLMALKNPNHLENFLLASANFYQTLEENTSYWCLSHAYTVYILKQLEKGGLICDLNIKSSSALDLNQLRFGYGVEERAKDTKMYYISFTKVRNILLKDLKWIMNLKQKLSLSSDPLSYKINKDKIEFITPRKKISLEQIKTVLILIKDLQNMLGSLVEDITHTTVHYYKLMKKCQIMMK